MLRFYPYRLQFLQALQPEDKMLRRNFCISMQTLIENNDEFIRFVVFSDEVTSHLSEHDPHLLFIIIIIIIENTTFRCVFPSADSPVCRDMSIIVLYLKADMTVVKWGACEQITIPWGLNDSRQLRNNKNGEIAKINTFKCEHSQLTRSLPKPGNGNLKAVVTEYAIKIESKSLQIKLFVHQHYKQSLSLVTIVLNMPHYCASAVKYYHDNSNFINSIKKA
ncbi:hypothetical protein ANN_06448 [Periplaneta americana]|uniref:Uncharacterized protein n=1 Tax=Periplaneta americana TaxID=6978 RepID=A0ABQ8TFD2_PERAM|nr:hypothetical protein ANN_06448 [Periplaneta americana]